MRKYLFYFALFLAGCIGNGDDGLTDTRSGSQSGAHVPEISSFVLLPNTAAYMENDGTIVVTAEISFRDTGLDIKTLWVRMPDGATVDFAESIATETGTFTEGILLPTDKIGAFSVEVWLVDEAGDSSVHRIADFFVTGDVQNSAGGIWNGTIANNLTGQSFEIHGVITEDNIEGRFLINGATLFVLQDISADGGQIAASISVSIRPDSQIIAEHDQWPNLGIMTGSLVERTRIEGEWSLDSGDFGTVTLMYDDLYQRGSDITRLTGTWKASWGTVYNIDALGELFAQSDNGCVSTGQIQIIDAAYNVYRVTHDDCCLAYKTNGLAILEDEAGTDDALTLMVGEGWFIADTWQRQ
jgi:hypothetical protein